MKITLAMTVNERKSDDLKKVFESVIEQDHDELLVVLDRTQKENADGIRAWWQGDARVRFVTIEGEPGWRSPVPAYNACLDAVKTDAIYFISSDTVQAPGNIARAKAILESYDGVVVHGRAECSCGPEGQEVNWGGTAPGNLLSDARHARPLGFIWAARVPVLRYDVEFADGLWHDDTDFFLRMWNAGRDFIFDDAISGVHLHHERPGLVGPEAADKMEKNRVLMIKKHGIVHPWPYLPRTNVFDPQHGNGARMEWRHL